ncbi:hypothetical protein P691DRAFT_725651 [Macrolepiota fuliginosa MF-IS2]|uniref:CUE domain-containing protein n=1 Tax=Macrolepiota fuliginosa MF-IS2 TaxID=1400762 RepID=A0A9P6C3E0_9AGAR|nr:hypothetical protein P691DRAFT_725651 [Macrolepiota fuliginosa MF-IS2]
MTIARLAPYPPTQARRQLPPSQLASLNAIVASTLAQTIVLPTGKRDTDSSRIYVQSYSLDASFQVLQALIWGSQDGSGPRISRDEESIRKYTLQLAEKIAPSLDLQTLLDLAIGYSMTKGSKQRLKAVLTAAADGGRTIHDAVEKDLVPALTSLLDPQSPSSQTQGLYALRKTAHCITSFLRASPPSFVRHFSHSKHFVVALAHAYDTSLASIATSYGGTNLLRNTINRTSGTEVDDWERIWVYTKVALVDAFHVILSQLLEDMSSAKGRALGAEAERTFDTIFALLELPGSSSGSLSANAVPLTPFLNRPLLADYQHSYSLSRTLASVLKQAEEKDARLDILESALAAFDSSDNTGDKEPGALKIVLRSYGIQQGIDNLGTRSKQGQPPLEVNSRPPPPIIDSNSSKGKGKAKASVPVEDPELDIKVTQILDVLPDFSPEHIRLLLGSERYKGDVEQVLGALLEGRAPGEEELGKELEQGVISQPVPVAGSYDISQRRNVFDDQDMDLSQVKAGKKDIESGLLQDRSFIDQMKADILRRAEAIFEEEEEEAIIPGGPDAPSERLIFSPEDELEDAEALKIKVMGDGEETDESDEGPEEVAGEEGKISIETILELAWTRDPKLFERDAATRRGKGREQLKKETGERWADEQIEGWKVMLDRNPKMQEKIKQKHEFSGNQPSIPPATGPAGPSHGGQGRGRGRGRGRGKGGSGGGRGGSTQGSSSDPNAARERSFKDKHKASRANHNRKRGHDKKMARAGAGAGVPPS